MPDCCDDCDDWEACHGEEADGCEAAMIDEAWENGRERFE